jgi:glycosyltransferase involved in cell wall biosynthesis
MISVIVPAHNESSVIERTLGAITNGASSAILEVIVVCNGCRDDTARKAREFAFPTRVIETQLANKAHALNLGDEAALFFPRVYVDADVSVTFDVLRALANRLERGDVHAVAPQPYVALAQCSRLVKAYYNIRARLPSSREGIGGSGVYALSETGRSRFGQFPNVTADDGFVRIQFKPDERETLVSFSSIVFAPHRIKDLLAIRTRAYYGSVELSRVYPESWKNRGLNNNRALLDLLRTPSLWLGVLIYLSVNILARAKTHLYFRKQASVWERDNTSRSAA